MKNKALKTAIIAVIGLLVLPAIGLMLAKERTDIKSMAADLPAMPAMFVEEDDIIRRLRMAIEDDPQHPVYIRTEWGRGYRFVCN